MSDRHEAVVNAVKELNVQLKELHDMGFRYEHLEPFAAAMGLCDEFAEMELIRKKSERRDYKDKEPKQETA